MGKTGVSDLREQVRAPVLNERDGIRIVELEDDPLAVNFADNTLPILQWIEVGGYAEEPTEVRDGTSPTSMPTATLTIT
jgi:hypothetical protein